MPADQYKKCMQRKKAYIDSRIEEANIDKGIIVLLTGNGKGKSTQDKEYDTAMAVETWNKAEQYLTDKSINLVVLDELTYMISYKYLDEQQILDALNNRPKDQHVVITGRAASDALIDIADTVSEVKDIKHAFRENIKAQKGVDL